MLSREMMCSCLLLALLTTNSVVAQEAINQPIRPDQATYERVAAHLLQKEYNQAQSLAEAVLKIQPKHPSFLEMYGLVLEVRGDYQGAIAAFSKSIELNPGEPSYYCNRGKAYFLRFDFKSALVDFNKGIQLGAPDPRFRLFCGIARIFLGEVHRGICDLAIAIHKSSTEGTLHAAASQSFSDSAQLELAIHCSTEAIRRGLRLASTYNNRGVLRTSKKEWPLAICDITEAIRLEPEWGELYYNRGCAYFGQGEYAKAQADFQAACNRGGERCAARAMANLFATCPDPRIRDAERALAYARQACRLSNYADALCLDSLAAAFANAGQWDEAVRWQTTALKYAQPDHIDGIRMRLELYQIREPYREYPPDKLIGIRATTSLEAIQSGSTKWASGDFNGAIAAFRRATHLPPHLVSAHYNLGKALLSTYDAPGAAFHFDQCLKQDPQHPQALIGRAQALLGLGRWQESFSDAEAALALSPGNCTARWIRAWALASLGKTAPASRDLDDLIREFPSDANLRFVRGHCYFVMGRNSEALEALTDAIRRNPSAPEFYPERALVFAALGRATEARADLEECLKLAPSLKGRVEIQFRALRVLAPTP